MHGSERLDEVLLALARDADDAQSDRPGDLDNRLADAAPSAGDQQGRPGGQVELADTVVGRRAGDGQGRGAREGQLGGLVSGHRGGQQGVLGVPPGHRVAEDLVPGREPGYTVSDRLDDPGDLVAEHDREHPLAALPGTAMAGALLPADRIHTRDTHRDQDLTGTGDGPVHLYESLDLRAAVPREDVRLGHLLPLSFAVAGTIGSHQPPGAGSGHRVPQQSARKIGASPFPGRRRVHTAVTIPGQAAAGATPRGTYG